MASRDIRSNKERVDELRSFIRQIQVVINGCKAVESAYEKNVRAGGNNYEDLHFTAKQSMAELEALLNRVITNMTNFVTNNGMVFQYRWEAGKGNIDNIDFASGNITCDDIVGADTSTIWTIGHVSSMVLTANNVFSIEGSIPANNTYHKIASVTANTIYSGTVQADTSNRLAKIVFEMTNSG